jgi:hypothetical protein
MKYPSKFAEFAELFQNFKWRTTILLVARSLRQDTRKILRYRTAHNISVFASRLNQTRPAPNLISIKYDGLQYLMSRDSDVQTSDTMKKLEKERSKAGQEQEELVSEDVNSSFSKNSETEREKTPKRLPTGSQT